MELIRISDSKLKVMLSAEDMVRYSLECEGIEQEDSPSRRAFWSILGEAKRQTGFDPAGEKVYVQMYPEKGGGCEMFVTKLGLPPKNKANREKEKEHSEPEESALSTVRERIYIFTTLADLLAACRRLRAASIAYPVRAYVNEDKSRFCLEADVDIPYLSEYNAVPGGRLERTYMQEHGRCFCPDAVRILGPLAD